MINIKPRIELNDSLCSIVMKMAGFNLGAEIVLLRLLNDGDNINPDTNRGGLEAIFVLDILGIYGSKIWMLYKDVCRENLIYMMGLLRAYQLGMLTQAEILSAIDNQSSLNVAEYIAKIQASFPNFGMNNELCSG